MTLPPPLGHASVWVVPCALQLSGSAQLPVKTGESKSLPKLTNTLLPEVVPSQVAVTAKSGHVVVNCAAAGAAPPRHRAAAKNHICLFMLDPHRPERFRGFPKLMSSRIRIFG